MTEGNTHAGLEVGAMVAFDLKARQQKNIQLNKHSIRCKEYDYISVFPRTQALFLQTGLWYCSDIAMTAVIKVELVAHINNSNSANTCAGRGNDTGQIRDQRF